MVTAERDHAVPLHALTVEILHVIFAPAGVALMRLLVYGQRPLFQPTFFLGLARIIVRGADLN
jgi:hypothetical protein